MIIEDLISSPITLILSITSIILSLLINFQLIDNFQLYFDKKLIFESHEYWRAFSSILCFGSINAHTAFQIFFFIRYLSYVETSYFIGQPGDFLLFIFFGWTFIWVYAYFCPTLFLSHIFDSYVTYYFYKRSPDIQVFVIGFIALASYIPIIMLVAHYFLSGFQSAVRELIGYSAAHLFFFIKDVIGLRYDLRILCVPQWVNDGIKKLLS